MFRLGIALFTLLAVAGLPTVAPTASGQEILDPQLRIYRPVDKLSGKITLVGSNTMSQVVAVWADSFRKFYPDVQVNVQVKGSVNAVASVINGEATFGLLSRRITQEEADGFEQKLGYAPTVITPTLEPIAIFVHKDNPIKSLTVAQIDGIFSESPKRGSKPLRTWGDLGLTGAWADRPIRGHGRGDNTGSQVFMQSAVLLGSEFRHDLAADKDNLEMVKAIAADPQAIGFAGPTYALEGVKMAPVAMREGDTPVTVHSLEALQGRYPLVRPLQLVVNHPPKTEMPAVRAEFLKYIFSRMGQEDVVKAGFQPIPSVPAQISLDAVGLGAVH